MKRPTLYSRSPSMTAPRVERATQAAPTSPTAPTAPAARTAAPAGPAAAPPHARALRLKPTRAQLPWLLAAALAVALLAVLLRHAGPSQPRLTQRDIDKAVLHTLATKELPSPQARAVENVRKSIVMVRGVETAKDGEPEIEEGVGTGVVIVDSGLILTNLHVALGAKQLKVEFADGSVSDASIISVQPEHDLAVLRAKVVPDDLQPATLRSTGDLRPGDHVVAVGFPFGIGPSASAGVISGLRREFRSPKGERVLTNLIQFDAAANPGNSGGPLVTMDGEVVGIVTAILNPTEQRVFIGIGFAVPIENAAAGVGLHPF